MKKSDPDQDAVYFAESTVFEDTLFDEVVSDTDIQALADELFNSYWWKSRGIPTPELSLRRLEASTSHARMWHPTSGRAPEIRFCVAQVDPWTLAHEASHIATNVLCSAWFDTNVQSHGREFRRIYTLVAEVLLGKQAGDDLREAFNRFVPDPSPTNHGGLFENPDPEGIFPRWRSAKQVEEFRRATENISRDSIRINGAIAL